MPINHKIFLAQFDAIKKLAEEGPCILIGRCADYALEDYRNVLSVFIHADTVKRAKRISRMYDMTEAKAKEMIIKTDKKRGSYYNYYTNKKWSAVQSYDVCLDSGKLGIDGCVDAIIEIVKNQRSNEKSSSLRTAFYFLSCQPYRPAFNISIYNCGKHALLCTRMVKLQLVNQIFGILPFCQPVHRTAALFDRKLIFSLKSDDIRFIDIHHWTDNSQIHTVQIGFRREEWNRPSKIRERIIVSTISSL